MRLAARMRKLRSNRHDAGEVARASCSVGAWKGRRIGQRARLRWRIESRNRDLLSWSAIRIHQRIPDEFPIEIGLASLVDHERSVFDFASDADHGAAKNRRIDCLQWRRLR